MVEAQPVKCVVTVRRLDLESRHESAEARARDLDAKLTEVTKQYTELAVAVGVVPLDMPFHSRVMAHAKRVRSWLPRNVDAANRAARVAGFEAGAPLETVVRELYQREQRAIEAKEKADAHLREARAKLRRQRESHEELKRHCGTVERSLASYARRQSQTKLELETALMELHAERALRPSAEPLPVPIRITKVEQPASYPSGPECSIQDAAAGVFPARREANKAESAADRELADVLREAAREEREQDAKAEAESHGVPHGVPHGADPFWQVWQCKIAAPRSIVDLAPGSDAPMRRAVREAFERVAGVEALTCFSGWNGSLTDGERLVALPDRRKFEERQRQAEAEAEEGETPASEPGSNYREVGEGKIARVDDLLAAKDAEIARMQREFKETRSKLSAHVVEVARLTSELEAAKRKPDDGRVKLLWFGKATRLDRPGDTVRWEGVPCLSVGQSLWIMQDGVPTEAKVSELFVADPHFAERRVEFVAFRGIERIYGDIDAKTGTPKLRTGAPCARTKDELRDLVFGKAGAASRGKEGS